MCIYHVCVFICLCICSFVSCFFVCGRICVRVCPWVDVYGCACVFVYLFVHITASYFVFFMTAMSEDRVWAEGLLIFYEIFKYLEEALDRLSHTLISDLDIPGMRRKEAFEKVSALERSIRCASKVYEIDTTIFSSLPFVFHEKSSGKPFQRFKSNPIFQDLAFYLGSNWKDGYKPRESVCQYLKHLEKIEQENPYYLMSYIYHLYMGLLSGGQILRRKKVLLQKFSFSRKVNKYGQPFVFLNTYYDWSRVLTLH